MDKKGKQTEQSQSTNLQKKQARRQQHVFAVHQRSVTVTPIITHHTSHRQQELLSALPQPGSKEGLDQGTNEHLKI